MSMLTSIDAKFPSSFACPPENLRYIKEGCFSATDILPRAVAIRPVILLCLSRFTQKFAFFMQNVNFFGISSIAYSSLTKTHIY